MTEPRDPNSQRILDALTAHVHEQVADHERDLVATFVEHYYSGTSAADLAERDPANLYGAALTHFNLLRRRQRGTPRLHIYNPQLEQHGWQSTHTIIDLATDDMPFLVDSVRMAINRHNLTSHLIVHPVFRITRDAKGNVTAATAPAPGDDGREAEAVMHFEVDRQAEAEVLDALRDEILAVVAQVRRTVDDWLPMRERMLAIVAACERTPPPIDADGLAEDLAFLRWVADAHFTYLGYREYRLVDGAKRLQALPESGLGILSGGDGDGDASGFSLLDASGRALALAPRLLIVNKTSRRATVHRAAYMEYLGVKRFDEAGQVIGEHRFLGLYSAAAYNRNTRDIPLLRRKVAGVIARAGYPPGSHAARALLNILENYPRDELFQVSEDELYTLAIGILQLQERQRVRLLLRRDPFGRFYSCLVFVPRERFATGVRKKITALLEQALGGTSIDFSVEISDSVLARIHFIIAIDAGGGAPPIDVAAIEKQLAATTRDWRDDLREVLHDQLGEEQGIRLFNRYGDAFRADYRERYPARVARFDIAKMERLAAGDDLAMTLYQPPDLPPGQLRFKLFHPHQAMSLSATLPMLENMGLRVLEESPSTIHPQGVGPVFIHDFTLEHREENLELDQIADKFQHAFSRVWHGAAENDGFNRLVLRARLDWRQVIVLRAYCKYLRQVRATFSQEYMERALDANPQVARLLVELFEARFDPAQAEQQLQTCAALDQAIEAALDQVANLDEDRILRGFFHAIHATLRSNFYQHGADGQPKPYVALKLNPEMVPDMPWPRPRFEIFVYGPRVEGLHLRGGPVARGGLRWSDRREDFRTEILGLVKAQMVKNAVIVPVGSKGGFVCKALPAGGDRDAIQAEVIDCYKTLIRGLLDLTDNLVGGAVVPPPAVVRHDGDDPYLVVAADKGTATFSDIANGVAADYGFWLGDAFASGGSAGYDHKKMGITARGGWESVKRHFRELGIDCQAAEFTAVGVGDMSGDVFGNGMLLSPHTRLVAAFDHRHIFIDPEPDAARGHAERARLFALPRSSWDDYDRGALAAGGGIWPRSLKLIELAPEARRALGVEQARFTPNELIRAILRAPVDLLWNGGIGTYVKASSESHAEVGDRASDALRVDARELRCRVVGEGGNLGLTQHGRIEYALAGGRINTDAIDNSGGVDCSDHEVNIKILLNAVITAGDMTGKQRDRLLGQMTDEVAELVLRNNYLQTLALSVAEAQAAGMLHVHARLLRELEKAGTLDRAREALPDDEILDERRAASRGLTRPEFAVLLAYVKIGLFQELLDSDLPDDPALAATLTDYFPTPLRDKFATAMAGHRLRREIVATQLANAVVNRAGMTYVSRLTGETGAGAADVVRAWTAAGRIFRLSGVAAAIDALDNRVATEVQIGMYLEVRKLGERVTRWLLRQRPQPLAIEPTVATFAAGIAELEETLPGLVGKAAREQIRSHSARLRRAGVEDALARRIASLPALIAGLDIIEVVRSEKVDLATAAAVHFTLGDRLGLHWLMERITALPRANNWQSLARAALRDDLMVQQRLLTADALQGARRGKVAARVDGWLQANGVRLARLQQLLGELRSGGSPDFTMLSVALRELRALTVPVSDG
jgi:glutamate dehydrogenase